MVGRELLNRCLDIGVDVDGLGWLWYGPTRPGRVSSAIAGFSPALMDGGLAAVTEDIETCVRDEFCDAVLFKGREMKGDEYAGEGP